MTLSHVYSVYLVTQLGTKESLQTHRGLAWKKKAGQVQREAVRTRGRVGQWPEQLGSAVTRAEKPSRGTGRLHTGPEMDLLL